MRVHIGTSLGQSALVAGDVDFGAGTIHLANPAIVVAKLNL